MLENHDARKSPLVLVVDDDELVRVLARNTLEAAGFTVEEAACGATGFTLCRELHPDLVLLDVMMPVMDGFELCSAIRSLPNGEFTPVLMMTGLGDVESVERAFEVGATNFVAKPVNWLVLIHHIRYVIRSNRVLGALRTSEAKNRALLDAVPDMIFQMGRCGTFLDIKASKDIEPLVPFRRFVGRKAVNVLPEDVATKAMRAIGEALRTGEVQHFECELPLAGQQYAFEARIAVSGEDSVLAIVRDITEQKISAERIRYLAYYDGLTSLPNRTFFRTQLDHAISHAKRHEKLVALLFLDLDNFKVINDTLGHAEGDNVLRQVASRLATCIRTMDMVGRPADARSHGVLSRFGGDEFALLLSEISCAEDAAVVAGRIIDSFSQGFDLAGQEYHVSTSIGIALCPTDSEDPETLFKYADFAMYSAKEMGKNMFQFYSASMNDASREQLIIEHDLYGALERNEFSLVYQPKQDMETGRVVGVEALLRWCHPRLGTLTPDRFIRIAEKSGLIIPIGQWVLETACSQARAWLDAGLSPLTVAVNLSGRQVCRQDLADCVTRILASTGLNPSLLELELTEGTLLEHADASIDQLGRLRHLGVKIAIDDFGTGSSSLYCLKRFPLDAVKIDRTFVKDIEGGMDDGAIAKAIIAMSRSLKLKVVAEGVEEEGQLAFLRGHGCEEAQGFLLSPPVPADEIHKLFAAMGGGTC